MACQLATTCRSCQGRVFVHVEPWRHLLPRIVPPGDAQQAFTSGEPVQLPMVAVAHHDDGTWSGPSQVNLPLSLRFCQTCGLGETYVDTEALREFVAAARKGVTVVDHTPKGGYR